MLLQAVVILRAIGGDVAQQVIMTEGTSLPTEGVHFNDGTNNITASSIVVDASGFWLCTFPGALATEGFVSVRGFQEGMEWRGGYINGAAYIHTR